jgi:hypothetical protein
MTDKVDPVEVLIERRQEMMNGSNATKNLIAAHEQQIEAFRLQLAIETAQIVAINAALSKLGYIDEEDKPRI